MADKPIKATPNRAPFQFGSSSMSDIPPASLTPPSSPPPLASAEKAPDTLGPLGHSADEVAEETIPVRNPARYRNAIRRPVVTSSDEGEDHDARATSPSPSPVRSPIAYSRRPVARRKFVSASSPASDEESDLGFSHRKVTELPGSSQSSNPADNVDASAAAPLSKADQIMAQLYAEEEAERERERAEQEEERSRLKTAESAETIKDAAGPYQDEDEEVVVPRSKKLKVCLCLTGGFPH
jgi:hypothetical protein